MSEGVKIGRLEACALAEEVMQRLAWICQRIEIAGSLRRGKELVGDIEIVCVPKVAMDLLGGSRYLWNDVRMAMAGYKMVKGGDHYQQYDLGICKLDLFVTSMEQWGVIYTIRTGSAQFSHQLVTPRSYGGMMPNGMHIQDGRLWDRGVSIETLEEMDLFAAMCLDWVEPEKR